MTLFIKKYSGVVVPMVSPFHANFEVDIESANKIALNIIKAGAKPFVLGSTGEGPSMSVNQKEALVKAVVDAVKGRSLVYAGLSSNSLISAIDEAEAFASLGADVLVLTLPYYFPVDDQQMFRFFESVANHSPLPIVLYNMPGMVKRSIPLEVADKLSQHPNILAMKDSERSEERLVKSVNLWKKRTDFSFLVGWAAMSATGLQLGADGIVPSTGNICPELYMNLYDAVLNGAIENANHLQGLTNQVSALYQQNRDLSHSIPALKVMMEIEGWCSSSVLPPMYAMSDNEKGDYIQQTKYELKQLINK